MTPQEIEAKSDELRARLQAMAAHKIGFGMDNLFRQILKSAYELVGLVKELAGHVETLSVDAAKKSNESKP